MIPLQRTADGEASDFDQAMAELLADGRVEWIIVNGQHHLRVAAANGA